MAPSIGQVLSQLHTWTATRAAEDSDAVLLERYIHQRDEAAFAALVARHGAMVLRLCRRVLGDVHEAEDAFQASFLLLARKGHALKQPEALPAWLYGVARRVALKARGQLTSRAASLHEALLDPRPDPLTQLRARELLDILDEEVNRLPTAQRSAVISCCLEGRTREEAASMLGWTAGSLKGHLERGRHRLHTRLMKRGIALSAVLSVVAILRGEAASAPLQRNAVRAALGGAAGSSAAALADSVLNGMAASKLAGVAVLAMTMALTVSALGLVYRAPAETPASASPQEKQARQPAKRVDAQGDPLPPQAMARLGSLRLFHGADVRFVVLSPDGKRVASTDDSGVNKLWDVQTGRELPLAEHLRHAFLFAAKGNLLGAEQQGNRLWDVATGKEVAAQGIDIVAARKRKDLGRNGEQSPDGTILAVRGKGVIQLLDAHTREELPPLQGQQVIGCNFGLGRPYFSPDGKLLAVSYGWGNLPGISLWDLATRKEVRRLQEKSGGIGVSDIDFSADGKIIAAADGRGVTLWDAFTGKWLHDWGHTSNVGVLAFTPDGKTLLTGANGNDRFLHSWDPFTGRPRGKWKGHEGGIRALLVTADGKHAISTGQDGTIRLWEVASGKEIGRIGEGKGPAGAADLSPEGKLLATWIGESIQLWDLASRQKVRSFGKETVFNQVFHLAFSPDGTKLASWAVHDANIRLWNVANGEELPSLTGAAESIQSIGDAQWVFSPDGRTLAIGDREGIVHLWDPLTAKELHRLGQPLKPASGFHHVVGALTFSPDGRVVAVGCSDQMVRLLEVVTGKERARFQGHRDMIDSLAFSPDGRLLASGSWDHTVMVWDVTGQVCPDRADRLFLDAKRQERLWADLADSDAAKAYQAMKILLRSEQTVSLLRRRLHPAVAVDPIRLDRLIADLDSDEFAIRQKAMAELSKLEEQPLAAYRKTLGGKPSLEVRRRVEELRENAARAWWDVSGERLRSLRAVETLELAGTKEARDVLKTLAEGALGARLTEQAKAALERLARR